MLDCCKLLTNSLPLILKFNLFLMEGHDTLLDHKIVLVGCRKLSQRELNVSE